MTQEHSLCDALPVSAGARFFRADLHIHSYGASHDVSDVEATPEAIVDSAASEGLAMIAIADHNEIANVRAAVQRGLSHRLLVIPAVELSTSEGHLLCYAPNVDALDRFFNRIQIADRRSATSRCQSSALQCLDLIAAEGGFAILAHIDAPGAFEATLPRLTPSKLDILCHEALEGFEVSSATCPITYTVEDSDESRSNAARERSKRLKLGSNQSLARVLNSDAHTLAAVGRNAEQDRRVTRYKMESPSFEGLRLALRAADARVRLEDEVPECLPMIESVQFTGAFLDEMQINFSPNLTCIIGGRGSGKSTTFEALCLIGGPPEEEVKVIDSDVWPDLVVLSYKDETNQVHRLARSREGDVENVEDPVTGTCSFAVESYRQGATNEISKRVQDDPSTLLAFLDKLLPIEEAIAAEDDLRRLLTEAAPKVATAALNVSKIPAYEKELKLKTGQLQRLQNDKAENVIKLQQQLEGEKRARASIEALLLQLTGAANSDAITPIIREIKASITGSSIDLGAPEAAMIGEETGAFEAAVKTTTSDLQKLTAKYVVAVRAQIADWKAKESRTANEIELKKQELLKHGIRLDMVSIQKIVSDEARARENLKDANSWVPELKRLRAEYARILRERWAARQRVATLRSAFAARASAALKGSLADLFVSLRFDESALSPDAERLLSEAMGWRTLQQLKARQLVRVLTLPVLLDCARRNDRTPVLALRSDANAPVFVAHEVETLFSQIREADLLAQLETVAVHDNPRLSVTKRFQEGIEEPRYVPREFKRLSLGQQQSVLLSLMLTSESRAPLVIDQPEDNLDGEFIYKTLVPVIRAAKERRQVIVVTHNANIAVLGDAELIVVLKATSDRAKVVTRGSIDHVATCQMACTVLEGSREAFERRASIYGIADAHQAAN